MVKILKKLKLKYLPVIEQAVKNGNMRLKDYAMFKDKIEIEQNKNQIYGSQLVWNNDNGQYELLPIMEPERSWWKKESGWIRTDVRSPC